MKALLEVQGLGVSYPSPFSGRRQQVIHDLSFQCLPGENLGLLGESGCGKSTTARAIMGLTPIDSGHFLLEGKSFSPPHPKIQMIFQDYGNSLNPRMTILHNIMEPLRYGENRLNRSKRLDRGYELLQQVGIDVQRADSYPHQFSGGQLQRIAIARALAPRPKLIICDEPVSALDLSIQAQVLELLKSIQREEGLSLLFVSHDVAVVRYLCQRCIVMDQGRIVEQGLTDDIIASPSSPKAKELIEAIPGQAWH